MLLVTTLITGAQEEERWKPDDNCSSHKVSPSKTSTNTTTPLLNVISTCIEKTKRMLLFLQKGFLYLMVRRQFWRSEECRVPLPCNCFQVHFGPEGKYLLVPSMDPISLFKNLSYSIGILDTI